MFLRLCVGAARTEASGIPLLSGGNRLSSSGGGTTPAQRWLRCMEDGPKQQREAWLEAPDPKSRALRTDEEIFQKGDFMIGTGRRGVVRASMLMGLGGCVRHLHPKGPAAAEIAP